MLLYNYFRSSAAFRVRIALNLKGMSYDSLGDPSDPRRRRAVRAGVSRHQSAGARPRAQLDNGDLLLQSLAIIDYLDETHPQPPLLPKDPVARAHVRAVAQIVACDIHPIDNLARLNYLRRELKQDDAAVNAWYQHWVIAGFDAIEALLPAGTYAFGNRR